jgi:hypothetical protein
MTRKKAKHPTRFPPIVEDAIWQRKLPRKIQDRASAYRMGGLRILADETPDVGWHVSVSHANRYPTFEEAKHIRDKLIPADITLAIIVPSPNNQSLNPNTIHMFEVERPPGKKKLAFVLKRPSEENIAGN